MATNMTGARAIISSCEQHGVTHIFGYPGGANIPIFDALIDSPIKLVLSRHEQGATHMADGFARASGKPGVVLVTSGPGATNAITGVMTAHMDSIPLVVLCGQTITASLGLDAFQEADVSGMSYPVVKHSYLVKDVRDIPRVMREAFHIATTGRPGPVLIDIPKDVSAATFEPDFNLPMDLPGYHLRPEPAHDAIAKAARLLASARRPVLIAGHGVVLSGAQEQFATFARRMRIPVICTLLGKGAFPERDELALGMLGMHGTAYANMAVRDCDCIVAIGSRWDDRIVGKPAQFCPTATKIHIDIDPAESGKMIFPDVFVCADASAALLALDAACAPPDTSSWVTQVQQWRTQYPLSFRPSGELQAQHVLHELDNLLAPDAIVTTDVGQHQMWAAQFLRSDPRGHWLSSGGAGTMGFGFPSAIGAQFANPDRNVVAIVGDGGFQMTLCELSTARNHRLPLTVIILDNRFLGMVRQWQDLFYDNRTVGVDMEGNPDFVKLAEAYGVRGVRLEDPSKVRQVLAEALAYREGPTVVHAVVEKEQNVFPMIPAGAPYAAMLLEPPSRPMEKPEGST